LPPKDALLLAPLRRAAAALPLSSWGGGDSSCDIRGVASESDSVKELVRSLTQEQTSRDTKKAFWMPSPRTSAGRHSGLPQPPAAAAAGAPLATVRAAPEAGAGRRPRAPPRRKAKGTQRGEEVDEEEAVPAAARVDDMFRGQGRISDRRRRLGLLPLLALGLVWLQQLAGY
jgi:hypothetical protein